MNNVFDLRNHPGFKQGSATSEEPAPQIEGTISGRAAIIGDFTKGRQVRAEDSHLLNQGGRLTVLEDACRLASMGENVRKILGLMLNRASS